MAGIYIHIPFCKQRCYYCDFHFTTSLKNKEEMIDAIIYELKSRKKEIKDTVKTIYFGGGTPSVLQITDINKIISSIYKNFTVSNNPEITIEANPDDLDENKISDLSKTPVNRFSVGIQSFHDKDLKFMNRAHNSRQALECIPLLKKYGFDNITIDLIYGVPNQNKEEWLYNLNTAFNLDVPHISAYALTVEENTPLNTLIKKGKYPKVSDKKSFDDFNILINESSKHGFEQYEISNFSKKGFLSKHNTSYWQGEMYIGVGPSAHSYNGITRRWNIANNKKYLDNIKLNTYFESEILSAKDKFNEYIMTGLRTMFGVSKNKILQDFGQEFHENFTHKTNALKHKGDINIEGDIITISKSAKFRTDGITSDLFEID